MAAIYLTEADVERLLSMPLAIEVVEEAFRRLAAGEAENVPRARSRTKNVMLHSMSAAAGYLGMVGWKCYTTTKTGARFLLGLADETGDIVALVEADRLGQMRTGATTGVAVEWMATPDASEVGIFGAGWQAQGQLAAVAAARPIRVAYVYSQNESRRQRFAEQMSARLGIDVRPVDRPQEAARDLPIVITATSSAKPVFDGMDLAESTVVCAVGSNWLSKAEIDTSVIRRADHIVCDSVEACQKEAGDFVEALHSGIFNWSKAVDLAAVVTGHAVGRGSRGGISLFKSVGMALEDVALGAKLVELARQAGAGVELPF